MLKGAPGAAGPELEDSARLMGLQLPAELLQPPPDALCDVWEDNWPAVRLFMAMQTQVRFSFQGLEGFDYTALPVVERRLGITPRQAAEAFDNLRVMERELIAFAKG